MTSVFNAGGLISIRLPEISGTRDARGRFTSAQRAMRERNGQFAEVLQADVVRNIEQRITRPGASTGRLLNVTASPGNRQYDTWHAAVGVVPFLDSSIAKYWRTFEQGSAETWSHPFTGTQLIPKGRAPFPVAHGQTPGLRTTQTGILPWMDGQRFVVKHEIAPRHAYRDAIDAANPRQFAIESARELLQEVWGRPLSG